MKRKAPNQVAQLRQRAEAQLSEKSRSIAPEEPFDPAQDALRLVHELEVHQIELQMQNEELRQVRADLERERDRYIDFYDFSPTGFLSVGFNTEIVQINLSGALLLRQSRSILMGVCLDKFVTLADRHAFLSCIRGAFLDKTRQRCEVKLTVLNSQPVTVAIEAAQSPDGQECRLVLSDISAARDTQEALQVSEARFRLAMEASTVGLWDWDVANSQGFFSAAYYQMLGYSPGEFESTRDGWTALIHPDDVQAVIGANQDCIENRLQSFRVEYRMKAKDGSWRWILGRGRAGERDDQGRALRMLGTDIDITVSKESEEKILAATAAAEQANNAKSRFLAAASHDLRQPLAALGMYVEVLKAKNMVSDEKLLGNMTNCIATLSELLADLLDISKLEAGVVVPELTSFPVAQLLDRLVAVHAPQALAKGLRLRCVASNLHARTDPVLLRRILSNFIANAIRYTAQGGVLVACRRHHGKQWIEVWDTGIGVASDKMGEIFEEFKQLESDERSRVQGNGGGGSGLGLAIVAKSAELLGLQVRVKSRIGHGSMFAIELPLGLASEANNRRSARRASLRIALVDDNASVLDALGAALQAKGHRVISCTNGTELLDLLEGKAPDVLITDYRLANAETGYEVIARARDQFGPHLPALIITGDTNPQLMRTMAARGIAVEHKPLDIRALELGIAKAVKLS
jgi:PAS domain S-box-containing protein